MGVEVSQDERVTPRERKEIIETGSIVVRTRRGRRDIYIEDA